MRKNLFLIVGVVILLSFQGCVQSTQPKQLETVYLYSALLGEPKLSVTPDYVYYSSPVDGSKQYYAILLPDNFSPENAYDLVVFLHGFGADERSGFEVFADYAQENGVILVSTPYNSHVPYAYAALDGKAGDAQSYMNANAVKDLEWVVAALKQKFRVQKFILVGHSMGGGGSLVFAQQASPEVKPDGVLAFLPWTNGFLAYNQIKQQNLFSKVKGLPEKFNQDLWRTVEVSLNGGNPMTEKDWAPISPLYNFDKIRRDSMVVLVGAEGDGLLPPTQHVVPLQKELAAAGMRVEGFNIPGNHSQATISQPGEKYNVASELLDKLRKDLG